MKKKTISIRLDSNEYSILSNNSKNHNMNNSKYIRSLILGAPLTAENHNQEIATVLCKLHVRLTELGLNNEEIAQEVQKLCQMLS